MRRILVSRSGSSPLAAPILFREIRARCMDLTVNQWLGEFDPHTRSQWRVIRAGPCTVLKTDGLRKRLEFDSTIPPPKQFAPLVKWYNIGFVIRGWQFDSVTGHQFNPGCSVKVTRPASNQ